VNVPFIDLRAQHDELWADIEAAFRSALQESAFIGGRRVASFEEAFAQFCGSKHGVAVASGTDALELALRACGVGSGDIVVTVPHTFIGTVEAVVQRGGVPRFVDIDPLTYNLNPERLRAYLTERCERDVRGTLRERESGLRVAAVLPIHLYGLPAPMSPILAVGQEFAIDVVEDACQAHGAEYRLPDGRWARVGTLGRVGCFSFYPSKNLGALGEAGAIITDDEELAARVRLLRDHGQSDRYVHHSPDGVNARMDAIQAAFLEIKLARLATWNEGRRAAAAWYVEELRGENLQLPNEPDGTRHVYHLFVIRVPQRDCVRDHLAKHGVGTGLHYPIPLHLQPAFAQLGLHSGSFPEAERAASEILSLPMHPHLSREQVSRVAARLREVLK
jgi:dTDP-4-amino-4,6-dideoxygalactose transaminase